MFKNVIVGVDGEEGGRDAIALAKWLRGAGGEMTFAHVYPGEARVWRGSNAEYDVIEHERALALLEQARTEAGTDARLVGHAASTVGRGLHELAEKCGADVLVIGSSRRGLLGRVLIGNDTRSALNGASCAVTIAPAGYGQRPVVLREIGVGYDGSAESEHALGVARQLAAERGTKVSAFEAVFFPARTYAAPAFPDEADLQEMVEAARERVARLEGIEPRAAYGDPAEELALYSASVDLLVIGSRSYGPIGRLVHGSTALRLARTARSPLLVLTRAFREAATTDESGDGRQTAAVGAKA